MNSTAPRPRPVSRLLVLATALLAMIFAGLTVQDSTARSGGADQQPSAAPSAKRYIERGKEAIKDGKYRKAVRYLSAAVKKGGGSAAHLLRGIAYKRGGIYYKATKDFAAYVKDKPGDATGYLLLGDACNFNLEPERALEAYNKALILSPRSVDGYIGRGLAYTALEEYRQAIKDYQWALTIDPDNNEAVINIGRAYMLEGRPIQAITYFERALRSETDPKVRGKLENWIDILMKSSGAARRKAEALEKARLKNMENLW